MIEELSNLEYRDIKIRHGKATPNVRMESLWTTSTQPGTPDSPGCRKN